MKEEENNIEQEEKYPIVDTEPNKLLDTIKHYMREGLIVLGVIIVGVGGFLYFKSVQAEKEGRAALELSRIIDLYQAGDYAKALEGTPDKSIRGEKVVGLKAIADEFDGTEPGKLASLYAGECLVSANNYTEAEKYFRIAAGASALTTRIGANAGLGVCQDKVGKFEEAANLFEKSASLAKEIGNEQQYQLFAALLFEKAGKRESAMKLYREIIGSNEYSELAGEAKAGIVRLGETID